MKCCIRRQVLTCVVVWSAQLEVRQKGVHSRCVICIFKHSSFLAPHILSLSPIVLQNAATETVSAIHTLLPMFYGSTRRARSVLHCEPFVAVASISHLVSLPLAHRILLINSRKSPPSTHSPAAKVAPALAPQPSPTSPTIRAGWPPTTELGGTTILAGTIECGKILTFSLTMQKGCRTQCSPM